ncbi:MAG TPA: oligosaccharide flippase family protein [Croceibacterium sp.]|nr:oligosaccharide flippase family protein [Croceibacterium sp.]
MKAESERREQSDIAALARGGRTNFYGFLLRLAARLPFLFIAGRLYGAEELGVFASAVVVLELVSQLGTMGQKRGLAQQLSAETQEPAHAIADSLVLSLISATILCVLLWLFPLPMFPSGEEDQIERLMPLALIPYCLTDVGLAALAYRYDVGSTVWARAIVEPWVISLTALAAFYLIPESGLAIAYLASIFAAALFTFVPLIRNYGLPRGWHPDPARIWRLAIRNAPLTAADGIEMATRKIDLMILGAFASPSAVGVYYVAQQVATLPQKVKVSFEPILGPVITRALKNCDYGAIARQVCQVGFWILAAQAGIALALGIPGEAVMGLVGPNFVGGTGALSLLLAAEVVAALAVVSEAALIYVARVRNLAVSIATITLQAILTLAVMLTAERLGFGDLYRAAGAAAALFVSLGLASVIKSMMLARLLGTPVNNWRWPLVYAAVPAIAVGWLATRLPEWLELVVGIPAILGVYCWVIWWRGFGPEDRVLFRRNLAPEGPA